MLICHSLQETMFYGCDLEYEVDDADPDAAKKLKERVST